LHELGVAAIREAELAKRRLKPPPFLAALSDGL
jgi:hypothetical protein